MFASVHLDFNIMLKCEIYCWTFLPEVASHHYISNLLDILGIKSFRNQCLYDAYDVIIWILLKMEKIVGGNTGEKRRKQSKSVSERG